MEEIQALGKERISKLLFKFSIPCVLGLLIGSFYNIVDQIFIGNSELGYLGNAATGVSFPVICVANAFTWCIGDGAAAFLSICAGRGDSDRAHKCVGTCITGLTKVSSIFFQAIGKPGRAMMASLVRDVVCFTPLALLLPALLERHSPGTGIHGILYAASISDVVALVVILALTIPFFHHLKKEEKDKSS